jgi:mono/diheme cytochrome c family protein
VRRWLLLLAVAVVGGTGPAPARAAEAEGRAAAERGRDAIIRRPMNPPAWSAESYENAWKQWPVAEKPADYARAFRQRYGLHEAPFDNHSLPLGLMETRSLLGRGIVNNCLLCHAGSVAGQTYIGLGNASLDLQGLFDELSPAIGTKPDLPFQFSHVRGTIDPISPVAFLMRLRDADLNLQKPIELDYFKGVCSRPPAWWLIKRKQTRDWTGGMDARSTRIDLANLLHPLNGADYIKKHEPVFADILAFLHTVEAPKYPFAVDARLAARGREVFEDHCARCHGTYGPGGKYPNKIVPLDTVGTDPVLAEAITARNAEHYNKSWFAQQLGPDGKRYQFTEHQGYQAPPLDGVWATAPYFHNGSVPTVYHVLNSKARPKVYTRSFGTAKEDYDPVKLGWKVTELARPPDAKSPAIERRKVYDTAQRGRGNGGHPFGDKLTEDERAAVIEYLKTL